MFAKSYFFPYSVSLLSRRSFIRRSLLMRTASLLFLSSVRFETFPSLIMRLMMARLITFFGITFGGFNEAAARDLSFFPFLSISYTVLSSVVQSHTYVESIKCLLIYYYSIIHYCVRMIIPILRLPESLVFWNQKRPQRLCSKVFKSDRYLQLFPLYCRCRFIRFFSLSLFRALPI